MDSDVFANVAEFIRKEWRYRKPVARETTLERDLGITGDDASEFMEKFFDRFGVDYAGFELARYFDGEGFSLIPLHWFIPRLRKLKALRSRHQLTVGDLERVALAGRWIDPSDCSRLCAEVQR